MTLFYLVVRSIRGRQFRSLLISFFILVLTGFLLATTVILRGMEGSLRTGLERLGADIIVVPYDATEEAAKAVMAGRLVTKCVMPADNMYRIAGLEAVERTSPQLYLASLPGSPYCAAGEMFIVAFDAETDFTVLPWLKEKLAKPLGVGDAIGGSSIHVADSSHLISLNGYGLNLIGNLDRTDLWLDRTLFVTFDTACDMVNKGVITDVAPPDVVTTISVDVKPGYDIERTAVEIMLAAPGTWPVRAIKLMRMLAAQRAGLIQSLFLTLGIVWALAVVLTGFVFSLMVNERRREIGMLRAVGASRRFIFRLFLTESAILSLGGGVIGIILGACLLFLLKSWLMSALDISMLFPTLPGLFGFMAGCFFAALALVLPALLYPAIRASRLDPAVAMREV